MGNYDFKLDLETRNTMSIINAWIKSESTILEFGPANGRLTKYLSEEKKCSVSIVEIDEESGLEAAKYADESFLGTEKGDIENEYWKNTNKLFDYIIFSDVLEHLSNPEKVLKDCISLLKKNGTILVSIPNVAHNSILIDLYNDEFNYAKTGLLDHTHIHFFTHKSFMKMLKKLGLYTYQIETIYSRVGNNEILNNYEDVPSEVASALRKRNSGSIYQYVYMLGLSKEKENSNIIYEKIDKFEEQESTCFWIDKSGGEAKRELSSSQLYIGDYKNSLVFHVPSSITLKEIRWDPMEHNCIIWIKKCGLKLENGACVELQYLQSNALLNFDQVFCFKNEDPEMRFQVPISNTKKIVEVYFDFYLIRHRLENLKMFNDFENYIKTISENYNNLKEHEKINKQTIKQLYKDVEHRDRDIVILNDDIMILKKDIESLKRQNDILIEKLNLFLHPLKSFGRYLKRKWSK